MAFKDHGEAILRGLEPKRLPYKGKWYTFPVSVSAATGLFLARVRDKAAEAADAENPDDVRLTADVFTGLDDFERKDMRAEILGDAYGQLIKADVPEAVVEHMEQTLIVWHLFGEEAAEAYWDEVGGPKAPQDRKAKSSGSTGKRSKASARSTRQPDSTAPTARSEQVAPAGPTFSGTGASSS